MATDSEFRLGAAPGNPETQVKLAILMWLFSKDNDSPWNHSKAFPISVLKSIWSGGTPETKFTLNKFAYFTVIDLESV